MRLLVDVIRVTTAAVQAPRQELVEQLPSQSCIRGDETPMKEQNANKWLWTFVATWFTVFPIRSSREATAIDDLLTTEFQGVVVW